LTADKFEHGFESENIMEIESLNYERQLKPIMTITESILQTISTGTKDAPTRYKRIVYRVQVETGEVIDERKVREIVAELQGQYPIIASKRGGYFMATDIQDIDEYRRTLLAHSRSVRIKAHTMRRHFKTFAGQQSL
jgi:hypothetical protein